MNGSGMQNFAALNLAEQIIQKKECIELIAQVFELWETFTEVKDCENFEDLKPCCPGCGGVDDTGRNMRDEDHEEFCWFNRAAKWLKGAGYEPPSCSV